MKNIVLLLFLIFMSINSAISQVENIQDFTNDNINDTIRYDEEYHDEIVFINGATNQSYTFYESEFYKADFLGFVSVPDELINEKKLLDTIVKICYPHVNNQGFNPALDFLLASYQSNKKIEKGYFSQSFSVPKQWNYTLIEEPKVTTVFIKKDDYNLHDFNIKDKSSNYGWLFYAGHNHIDYSNNSTFAKILHEDKSTKILGTQHGLILVKENKYRWIFHSNHSLTRGPGKLRWKSIEKILVHKDYVFLHHVSPVVQRNRVFVIDLKTGKVARLRLSLELTENSYTCFDIEIKEDKLQIISNRTGNCNNFMEGEEKKEIELKLLFKELKDI